VLSPAIWWLYGEGNLCGILTDDVTVGGLAR